mgnify:CR=1 FL=1
MIEEIVEIGDILIGDSSGNEAYLAALIEEIEVPSGNEKNFVAKIDFSTKEKIITINCAEEVKDSTAKDYVYVGSAEGSNSPQWFASTKSFAYFLTETIPNLAERSIPVVSDICKKILDDYFVNIKEYLLSSTDLTEEEKMLLNQRIEKKYMYFLNTDHVMVNDNKKLTERPISQIYKELIRKGKSTDKVFKQLRDAFTKECTDGLKKLTELKPQQIGLYVLCVDGKPLTSYPEYVDAVVAYKRQVKKGAEKTGKKQKEGNICYICLGTDGLSFEGLKKPKFKYFTTNQNIFASYLDQKNYAKNITVCEKCLSKLVAGDIFLRNKLKTQLGSFDVYVLPTFVYTSAKLTKNYLEDLTLNITNSLNTAWNYNSLEKLRDDISNFLSFFDQNHYFLLNLIFYREAQAGTKIMKFIPDINPSIFDKIYNAASKVFSQYIDLIGNDPSFRISLESIYYSVPIRLKNRNESTEAQRLLNIYDAIFSGKRIARDFLIENFIKAVGVVVYGKEGYNLSKFIGNDIASMVIRMVFVMKFLEFLDCLEVERGMDVSQLNLSDDLKSYIQQMNYDEPKTALFLLGVLIGEIGAKQYLATKDRQDDSAGHKPILNKINYNGIDRPKLIRLCSDVHNKLRQEKLLPYTEMIFAEMKRLLDKHIDSWKLDKYETLFYILSGYAYKTQKVILNATNSQDTSN